MSRALLFNHLFVDEPVISVCPLGTHSWSLKTDQKEKESLPSRASGWEGSKEETRGEGVEMAGRGLGAADVGQSERRAEGQLGQQQ